MNISDLAKIMDAISKMRPDEIGTIVQQQTAPIVQMLAGISHSLDDLNANIVKLTEELAKRDDTSAH